MREERADGTVRHTLTGRHFKNALDADGATKPAGEIRPEPWTVIELVHRAVTVLEDLSTEDLLFPRSLSANPHARQQAHGGAAISTHTANNRITYFAAFANSLAKSLGRDHEMIPDDPAGPISMRRFRRTVAWFIYRQPGGPVALGLQYGHLRQNLAAAYGGRTKQDMLTVLDFERQLTLADTLAEANDRLTAGEGVSGPAADRYVTATRTFESRYAGGFATRAQLRALGNDLQLQFYEAPDALLTCNYDPYKALCDTGRGRDTPQRTPSVDRCDPACGNISRTDTHIARAQREVDQLQNELGEGLNPGPIARRQAQRIQTLEKTIRQHENSRHTPGPATS